jgi:hypothetical protein
MPNFCLGSECTGSWYRSWKHPFYSIGPKMMFGSVSEHFANLQQVIRSKTCVSGLNALFWCTEVVNHPFYCIGPKMMFGSVSEHFANLREVTRCKTCVRAAMQYFWVPKSLNISIGPKMMFGSVSEYFTNLRKLKRCKTYVSELNALFRGTEVVKHPFYSTGPIMMFGSASEHCTILWQVKRCKTCVWVWMQCFGVPKLWSIHSTPLDPNWCLGLFQSISPTFNR